MKQLTIRFNQQKLREAKLTEDYYMSELRQQFQKSGVKEISHNVFRDTGANAMVNLLHPIIKLTHKDYRFITLLDECTAVLGEEEDDIIQDTLEWYAEEDDIIDSTLKWYRKKGIKV